MTDQNFKEEEPHNSLINIIGATDLLGLSKPIMRLLENISRGIGAFAGAWLLKRNAKATASGLKAIDHALKKTGLEPVSGETTIQERAKIRLTYQQVQQQKNIENVIEESYRYLADNPEIKVDPSSSSYIDDDWMARFTRHAQEVHSELMQQVWARVLAHQSIAPGSYSFRALDTLSVMSRDDAIMFQKICQVAYHYKNTAGILMPNDKRPLQENEKFVNWDDIFLLETFGLFYTDGLLGQFKPESKNERCEFKISETNFLLTLNDKREFDIAAHHRITPLGMELMKLVSIETNKEYVDFIIRLCRNRGYGVEIKANK